MKFLVLCSVLALSLAGYAQQPIPATNPHSTMKAQPAMATPPVPAPPKMPSTPGPTEKNVPVGKVQFENIKDGDVLPSTFKVVMGVKGLKVRPAGEALDELTTGHHHIIIDGGAISVGQPIPNDEKHLHFGKAQTEVEVKLPAGEHTLTLQFADGAHRSYGPKFSSTVKIKIR